MANSGPSTSRQQVKAMTTLRSGKAIPIEDLKKDKQRASSDPKLSQITSNSKKVMEETTDAKEKEAELLYTSL